MNNSVSRSLYVIAKIHTEFPDKFGIPRQSGLVPQLRAEIVFEPEFRTMDAIRGLEEYSHIWLIWEFSKSNRKEYSLTVTPPRLGGKVRKGVFATRSPFRPNPIGLSSVQIEDIYLDEKRGPVIVVFGADLLDGTPIYDIKPYLPYTDAHPQARGSFGEIHKEDQIQVIIPESVLEGISSVQQEKIKAVLAQDPRAAYNKKEDYVYGMSIEDYDIRFVVKEDVLTVTEIVNRKDTSFQKVK